MCVAGDEASVEAECIRWHWQQLIANSQWKDFRIGVM